MKTKITALLKGIIPFMVIALVFSVSFHACQKEDITDEKEVRLKTAVVPLTNPTLYWGHVQYTRQTGKPVTETVTISGDDLKYYEGCLHLKIQNGFGGMNLVDNAVVKIDGETIVFPGDFETDPLLITKEICGKTGDFTLEIQVRGEPGCYIEVWIEGTLKPGYAFVDSEGGQLSNEDGSINITFPESSVTQKTLFKVTLTDYPTLDNFNDLLIGPAYLLEPDGYVFDEPVTVKIKYDPELFINENNIRVVHWFPSQNDFENILPVIDKDEHTASFTLDHFSGVALYESSENYFMVNDEKHILNMGYNVWFSELDCGNKDIYAHGIYLTSNISFRRINHDDGSYMLAPEGKGDILILNLFNKNNVLIPGNYLFVDKVECNGQVTDGGSTFTMGPDDKFVTAVKEMNDPTCYGLGVDLEIDWDNIDFDNIPQEVINKYMNYINSRVGIQEGSVNVEKVNDTYVITLDCTDKNGNKITGIYAGKLTYIYFAI